MSGAKSRPTAAGRCSSLTMPAAMQWPMFDETAGTRALCGSIANAITVAARPLDDAPHRIPMPPDDGDLTGPGVEMPERDHEHQRAREIRVVRRVRIEIEERQGTSSDLVGDPSRLFVAPLVHS